MSLIEIPDNIKSLFADSISIDNYKDLKQVYIRGDAIAFVGAGLSEATGIPAWKKLVFMLGNLAGMSKIKISKKNLPDYLDKIESKIRKNLKSTMRSELKKIFNNRNIPHTPAHEQILSSKFQTCITTNFDNVLDSALCCLNNYEFSPQIYPQFKLMDLERDKVCYLHGNVFRSEKIVFSRKQYTEAYQTLDSIIEVVKHVYSEKSMVFIGFSFDDPDFDKLWGEINEISVSAMYPVKNKHFILVGNKPDALGNYTIEETFYEEFTKRNLYPVFFKRRSNGSYINLHYLITDLVNTREIDPYSKIGKEYNVL